ncbi:hypothetical protein EVAR_78504_1 [Eumeta japonica]|uniref:Uncharacterized protein n=1 Tax=Eumeta variegata TaxID=151549 RepID=A0A4C1TYA9_EUMVA|nr:hypothetical protein EVAR_78504_1 [Eumeta japonica]
MPACSGRRSERQAELDPGRGQGHGGRKNRSLLRLIEISPLGRVAEITSKSRRWADADRGDRDLTAPAAKKARAQKAIARTNT